MNSNTFNIELLKAKIYLYSALPLLEEIVKDIPQKSTMIKKWNCVMQFSVKNTDLATYLHFSDGNLKVKPGYHPSPTISLTFKDMKGLNNTLGGGKPAIPKISGFWHILLLIKALTLLKSLTLLLPEVEVTEPDKRKLKVKLLLYMVTGALEQLSTGDDYIQRVTLGSNNKVVQWVVKPDGPSAHINLNRSNIKAHKGTSKTRPFTTIEFRDVNAAYDMLTGKIDIKQGTVMGFVNNKGSAEYAMKAAQMMKRVEDILQPKNKLPETHVTS